MSAVRTGPVLPETEGREFAYQNERVCRPIAVLLAFPPHPAGGVKPPGEAELRERERYGEYELRIERHTGTSLLLTLTKKRRDTVAQRMANGRAVEADVYQRTISFAELVNTLFGPGCFHCEQTEAFPESVCRAMREAYGK